MRITGHPLPFSWCPPLNPSLIYHLLSITMQNLITLLQNAATVAFSHTNIIGSGSAIVHTQNYLKGTQCQCDVECYFEWQHQHTMQHEEGIGDVRWTRWDIVFWEGVRHQSLVLCNRGQIAQMRLSKLKSMTCPFGKKEMDSEKLEAISRWLMANDKFDFHNLVWAISVKYLPFWRKAADKMVVSIFAQIHSLIKLFMFTTYVQSSSCSLSGRVIFSCQKIMSLILIWTVFNTSTKHELQCESLVSASQGTGWRLLLGSGIDNNPSIARIGCGGVWFVSGKSWETRMSGTFKRGAQ